MNRIRSRLGGRDQHQIEQAANALPPDLADQVEAMAEAALVELRATRK